MHPVAATQVSGGARDERIADLVEPRRAGTGIPVAKRQRMQNAGPPDLWIVAGRTCRPVRSRRTAAPTIRADCFAFYLCSGGSGRASQSFTV